MMQAEHNARADEGQAQKQVCHFLTDSIGCQAGQKMNNDDQVSVISGSNEK
jgi:hypothetical protein